MKTTSAKIQVTINNRHRKSNVEEEKTVTARPAVIDKLTVMGWSHSQEEMEMNWNSKEKLEDQDAIEMHQK